MVQEMNAIRPSGPSRALASSTSAVLGVTSSCVPVMPASSVGCDSAFRLLGPRVAANTISAASSSSATIEMTSTERVGRPVGTSARATLRGSCSAGWLPVVYWRPSAAFMAFAISSASS